MAVYAYSAVGAGGRISGTISADSPRTARDQLRAQGLSVREMTEQRAGSRRGRVARYLASRQSGRVTGLLQEMATLLAAGIPLLQALDTITRQHTGRFKQCIMLLRDHVASGGSLAEAMAPQPALFDELCINIVEVGQNAGTLDIALGRLVEYRRKASQLRNRVASALIYPAIVLTVGIALSIFLMTFVLPNILTVLIESGRPLPLTTRIVKAASDTLIHGWWAILLAAGLAILGVTALLRSDRGRLAADRASLRLPILGDLIRKQSIARLSMVIAALLRSDIPFVRAVQIAQRTTSNRVLRGALIACERAVFAGRDIADALERTAAFPPLVIQVFAVGQASGRLESMLDSLAADYDTQVDITAARLMALLEPITMIFLALTVGAIAFATILPILEAGNVL